MGRALRAAMRSGRDRLVMTDEETALYTAWAERNAPYCDGPALQRAFIDGLRERERAALASADGDPWSRR